MGIRLKPGALKVSAKACSAQKEENEPPDSMDMSYGGLAASLVSWLVVRLHAGWSICGRRVPIKRCRGSVASADSSPRTQRSLASAAKQARTVQLTTCGPRRKGKGARPEETKWSVRVGEE